MRVLIVCLILVWIVVTLVTADRMDHLELITQLRLHQLEARVTDLERSVNERPR